MFNMHRLSLLGGTSKPGPWTLDWTVDCTPDDHYQSIIALLRLLMPVSLSQSVVLGDIQVLRYYRDKDNNYYYRKHNNFIISIPRYRAKRYYHHYHQYTTSTKPLNIN